MVFFRYFRTSDFPELLPPESTVTCVPARSLANSSSEGAKARPPRSGWVTLRGVEGSTLLTRWNERGVHRQTQIKWAGEQRWSATLVSSGRGFAEAVFELPPT